MTYPQQPYRPQPYPQQIIVTQQPTSGAAVTSLVFGIIGVLGGFCLFGAPCVIAVVVGHMALADLKDGTKRGRGMALAGLILGYLFVVPAAVVTALAVTGNLLDTAP